MFILNNMWYSKVIEKIILPIASIVTRSSLYSELAQLRRYDNFSEEQLDSLQKKKLSKLLSFTVKNSEYYKLKNIEILDKEDPYSILKSFPILRKDDIRAYSNMMLTSNKNLVLCESSGSSGKQTRVFINKKEEGITQAIQLHWWNWAGYISGNPLLQTGITLNRSFFKRMKDLLFRTIYISAFNLSEKNVVNILTKIKSKKNISFVGYASSLYVFASIAKKYNLDIKFQTAISLGDKLFPHFRERISKVFNTKVYETYGCSEGMLMAAQKDLKYMYIMSPHVYIEIVDDHGQEVEDGQMGHVLVTNLNSFTMPLIRYEIGDLAIKLPKEKYPENRDCKYPLFEVIIGRDTDIVRTRLGNLYIVHTFTGIFEHYSEILQFCIIQKELDGILIQIIKSELCTNDYIEVVKKDIYSHIIENPEQFYINIVVVDEIENTKSGKPQIIQSFLGNMILEN